MQQLQIIKIDMAALKGKNRVHKLEVLKLIDQSVSFTVISEKYNIGRSTVRNREKIEKLRKRWLLWG